MGVAACILSALIGVFLTVSYKETSQTILSICMVLLGLMIGGLHHLLCVTCSADLGQKSAMESKKKATSAVTGIIDGLGSMGTSVG